MTRIPVALFNYQHGGQCPTTGRYDFGELRRAFAQVSEPPALVLYCESKGYRDDGGRAKYAAAEALADEFDEPYVIELGSMARGPMPPAILYNPNILVLRRWWQHDDPGVYEDQRNVALFGVRQDSVIPGEDRQFMVWVQHWEPLSGDVRLEAARRAGRYGDRQPLPVIGGGDLNATASGPHLPQRAWEAATYSACSHKGLQGPDGLWGPDTRALDHLIGSWYEKAGKRRGGCGYRAIAEMAWRADPSRPILPTVNDGVDDGGPLLIDWLLVNDAMAAHVDISSYEVHIAAANPQYPSDHRLVTAAIEL